jgi:hypothetical protein
MTYKLANKIKWGEKFSLLNEGVNDRKMYTAIALKQGNIFSLDAYGNKIIDFENSYYNGNKPVIKYKKENGVFLVGAYVLFGKMGANLEIKRIPGNVNVKLMDSPDKFSIESSESLPVRYVEKLKKEINEY